MLLLAAVVFLAGCEVGSQTKGKSPYRAPSGGTSAVTPGTTAVEVATPFTVQVTVKDKSGFGIPNITPTISATGATFGTSGVTITGCTSTDRKGLTTCTLQANRPDTYTIAVVSPVKVTAATTVAVASYPRSISFTTNPSAAVSAAGATNLGNPVVNIKDKAGNVITTATHTVTLSLTSATSTSGGTATLSGDVDEDASAGVATFAAAHLMKVDLIGTYTLTASITDATTGIITGTSSSFAITAGSASTLKFKVQPSTTAATNEAFAIQPVVSQTDAQGNEVATDDSCIITLSLMTGTGFAAVEPGDQIFASSTALTMTDGVANFQSPNQSVRISRIGATATPRKYKLRATASGLCNGSVTTQTVDSTDIEVNLAKMPYQLGVIQPPGTAALNEVWTNQPIIGVYDVNGSLVATDNTTNVVMKIQSVATVASGQLLGSTTIQAVNGVVQYQGLKILGASSTMGDGVYTYRFTGYNPPLKISTNPIDSTNYITTNGLTPAAVQFKVQPANAEGGSVAVNQQMGTIVVKTVDSNGYFCFFDNTSKTRLQFRPPVVPDDGDMEQGGFDIGNITSTSIGRVVNGLASFTGISFTTAGPKSIFAMGSNGATTLTEKESDLFAVKDHASDFDHLSFGATTLICDPAQPYPACQPDDAAGAGPWTKQPRVAILDKYGNLNTDANGYVVTIRCVHDEPCSLMGTTSVTVQNGTAFFSDLQMNVGSKSGILLEATVSPAITITAPAQARTFNQTD